MATNTPNTPRVPTRNKKIKYTVILLCVPTGYSGGGGRCKAIWQVPMREMTTNSNPRGATPQSLLESDLVPLIRSRLDLDKDEICVRLV